jgi:hypothetical protein
MTSPQGLNANLFQPKYYPSATPEKPPRGGLTTWGDQQPVRKTPKTEGSLFDISKSRAFFQNNQVALDQDLTNLRKSYGFPADDSVATFLANRRAISSVLLSAVPHLKEYFGADSIVNLEVSTDDDDSQTLYAVAVWHKTVPTAAHALANFSENWWLDHMTPSTADLAFTYEIF